MAVVSLIPLGVLLYISAEYVLQPLSAQGQTTAVYGIFAILGFTAVTVILGYVLVRRDTVRAIDAISEGEARLDRLHQATGEVASQDDPQQVQATLVTQACELVGAERGAFWIPVRADLVATVAVGMSTERARNNKIPIGQGIVGKAVAERRVMLNEELSQTDKNWEDRTRTRTESSLVVPLELGEDVVGVLDLRNKKDGAFTSADSQLASGLARQAALFLANAAYRDTHERHEDNINQLMRDLCNNALCWPGHIDNVQTMCGHLADKIGLPDDQRDELLMAALYHDIGLLDCDVDPAEDPPGGPIEHASLGADRLEASALWEDIAPIVRAHHERMDGTGPLGLRGFAIPMVARILALAEYIDTVTNPNSPWGTKTILDLVDELSDPDDRRFDRQILDGFLEDFLEEEEEQDEASDEDASSSDGNDEEAAAASEGADSDRLRDDPKASEDDEGDPDETDDTTQPSEEAGRAEPTAGGRDLAEEAMQMFEDPVDLEQDEASGPS